MSGTLLLHNLVPIGYTDIASKDEGQIAPQIFI
jgi:hypothetical protein